MLILATLLTSNGSAHMLCLQALEAMKIITGSGKVMAQRMLLVDGFDGAFRNIKLRGKSSSCAVCGDEPTVNGPSDDEAICGIPASDSADECGLVGFSS